MMDTTVVIPVFNENVQAVTKTYNDLKTCGYDVVIVDDGSHMDFADDMNVISYRDNVGYGHALKVGIQSATTSTVITMDGDGEHTVEDVKRLHQIYSLRDDLKMVVGQRFLNKEAPHRWFGRKVINLFASLITGHYLVDLNSGLRVIDTKTVMKYFPILCDTFSFTTSLTISMVSDNHRIVYYPIDLKPRFSGRSHVKLVRDGLITLWYILFCGIGCRTRGVRSWIRLIVGRLTRS